MTTVAVLRLASKHFAHIIHVHASWAYARVADHSLPDGIPEHAYEVGVGGFLGIGERDVAIPFEQIKLVNEPRAVATTATTPSGPTTADPSAPATPRSTATAPGAASPTAPTSTGTVATDRPADTAARAAPDHAMLTTNMTKDQLKAAPEFKYAR